MFPALFLMRTASGSGPLNSSSTLRSSHSRYASSAGEGGESSSESLYSEDIESAASTNTLMRRASERPT